MNKDKEANSGSLFDVELIFYFVIIVLVLSCFFMLLLALPLFLFLRTMLDEREPIKAYLVTVVIGLMFYLLLYGVGGDYYQGLVFGIFDEYTRLLFERLLEIKSIKKSGFSDYPLAPRLLFWSSFPCAVIGSLYFKWRADNKKAKSKESFERVTPKGLNNLSKFMKYSTYPIYGYARLMRTVSNAKFSSVARARTFFIASLMLLYTLIYLTFGPISSWHIHFGFLLNHFLSIFELITPWAMMLIKQVVYFQAALFPIAWLLNISENRLIPANHELRTEMRGAVYLGEDHLSNPAYLTNDVLNHHVHVVGASGFGKTTFLLNIIKGKIDNGEGVIFVDLKGDVDTVCEVMTYAKNAGRHEEFEFFSISEDYLNHSKHISLFSNGNALEIKDKLMGAFKYDHDYYKKRIESFLIHSLRALVYLRDTRGEFFDLDSIYKLICGFEHIEELMFKVDHEDMKRGLESLIQDKKFKEDLTGLKADIEGLIKTDFGHLLSGDHGINFFDSMRESKIVYIHLDSQRYEISAEKLGRIILQDIKTASARIVTSVSKAERNAVTLIVDEFANLATEQFVGFLNRARASGIGIVIAHQELSDLDVFSPVVKDQIMTNTSTMYCFLQKLPDSVELISGIAGTQISQKETAQTEESGFFMQSTEKTGMGSIREVEEFRIHPNLIKELKRGECFLISKYPVNRLAKIYVNHLKVAPISQDELMELLRPEKQAKEASRAEIVEQNNNSSEDWL